MIPYKSPQFPFDFPFFFSLNSGLCKSSSVPSFDSDAGPSHLPNSLPASMMECHEQQNDEGAITMEVLGCEEKDGKEEEVDRFIGKMGLTVSDSKGNEVKLSKYLKMAKCGSQKKKLEKGVRELKKLEWAMNDGDTRGIEDIVKRINGMGLSLVKK